MQFTDKEAKRILKQIRCCEVVESIDTYPENERDGRSDLQILYDEISYYAECYNEDGHVMGDGLVEAREWLKETKNGTVIPCYKTFPPVPKYSVDKFRIEAEKYKRIIAEYEQLKRYEKKLRGMI